MLETYLVSLLVKLAAVASIASVLARSGYFKGLLMEENRTIERRLYLALWLGLLFGGGVAVRLVSPASNKLLGADLGLEGSLLAGLIGGYVTGLACGVIVAVPAAFAGEQLALPLLAGIGVFGGLIRDCAPAPEEIWRFSPFFDLNVYRFFKEKQNHRRTAFHLVLFAGILVAEFLRQIMARIFEHRVFVLTARTPDTPHPNPFTEGAVYAATLFAVAIPIKIWSSARNEKKLEEQERLLAEARLAALTSQINPHFLFNTLNSVSSLIRTNPELARVMVVRLSKVLRRLLRKNDNFSALRDELNFIEDYLSIEVVRFGDKLRFEKDVDEDTLDMLVPSMVLQPLVENSIKHGLSNKVEGGTIRIRAHRAASRLQLLVEDDGVGIPEERLAALLEQQGIGVSNVHERLRVLFANEYRMWVDSRPGEGTRVHIEIPELQPAAATVGA